MDKYLFVGLDKKIDLAGVLNSGANKLMIIAYGQKPDLTKLETVRKAGLGIGICINAYDGDCAADPNSTSQLSNKIQEALSFNPEEIWIDHLRFHGYWETKMAVILNPHQPCRFCQHINREDFISRQFSTIKKMIPGNISLGFFAVPFYHQKSPEYQRVLGLNYLKIKELVDLISPMVYHQMLGKPATFINEYVSYLFNLGFRQIIPIIQTTEMPAVLSDDYSAKDLTLAFQEATKPPSTGVSLFTWNKAIETGKKQLVINLLKKSLEKKRQ